MAKEKPLKISPPKINIEKRARRVVTEVIIVRAKVSFIDKFAISLTSSLWNLPRFSLNEKYGEIDRVKFAAKAKGLGIYDFIPKDPTIYENTPYIGFSLLDEKLVPSIDCFVFDSKGEVEKEIFKFNERIEIRLSRKLTEGRSRMNCTAKGSDNHWRWFGHQFYLWFI